MLTYASWFEVERPDRNAQQGKDLSPPRTSRQDNLTLWIPLEVEEHPRMATRKKQSKAKSKPKVRVKVSKAKISAKAKAKTVKKLKTAPRAKKVVKVVKAPAKKKVRPSPQPAPEVKGEQTQQMSFAQIVGDIEERMALDRLSE